MTLVDSLDSILMLYAYAGPSQDSSISKFALTYDDKPPVAEEETSLVPVLSAAPDPNTPVVSTGGLPIVQDTTASTAPTTEEPGAGKANLGPSAGARDSQTQVEAGPSAPQTRQQRVLASKANTISSLSITLTLLSILVALRSAALVSRGDNPS
jgi:high-affinity nickel-transport protein